MSLPNLANLQGAKTARPRPRPAAIGTSQQQQRGNVPASEDEHSESHPTMSFTKVQVRRHIKESTLPAAIAAYMGGKKLDNHTVRRLQIVRVAQDAASSLKCDHYLVSADTHPVELRIAPIQEGWGIDVVGATDSPYADLKHEAERLLYGELSRTPVGGSAVPAFASLKDMTQSEFISALADERGFRRSESGF